jgi:hypothetical protein
VEYPFEEGTLVRAIRIITEDGGDGGDFDAPFPTALYVHATAGNYGIIGGVDDSIATVRFYPSGTATVVGKEEIEFVSRSPLTYVRRQGDNDKWMDDFALRFPQSTLPVEEVVQVLKKHASVVIFASLLARMSAASAKKVAKHVGYGDYTFSDDETWKLVDTILDF